MKFYRTLPDFAAISHWTARYITNRLSVADFDFESYITDNPLPEITTDSRLGEFIGIHKLDEMARFVLLFLFEVRENPEIVFRLFQPGNPAALHQSNLDLSPTAHTLRWLLRKPMHQVAPVFRIEHPFYIRSILQLNTPPPGLKEHHGVVEFVPGIYDMFATNVFQSPRFGENFPARLITTNLDLNDIVAPDYLKYKMNIIINQPMFERRMREGFDMDKQMPRGFRVLMIGPPGTGKTMAAGAMGLTMNREVYQVMLSQVLNKYIGESEKNLDRLFNMAEGKGWILFFDEADSLFGNRGEGEDAGSKNRNELISYLLQRIENYNGLVFAATNLEDNMDVAFKRRFQEHLRFNLPTEAETLQLWKKYLPCGFPLASDNILPRLSTLLLPPSSIANVCNRLALYGLYDGSEELNWNDIEYEVKREQRMLGLNA
jgi:AAA+ superfamily predicted ATPase